MDHGGFTVADTRSFACDRQLCPHDLVFPVSRVWPMGYSWSSFVAQSVMLDVCRQAGLDSSKILADGRPAPRDMAEVVALATDDIMAFSRRNSRGPKRAMDAVDVAMGRIGVVKHDKKNVTGVLDATFIGIDLRWGTHLHPNASKLRSFLLAILLLE